MNTTNISTRKIVVIAAISGAIAAVLTTIAITLLLIFLDFEVEFDYGHARVHSGDAPLAARQTDTGPWGYAGLGAPPHWGHIREDYQLCAVGTEQSPIDINNAQLADLPDLQFHYAPIPLDIKNNGHSIQVQYEAGDMTVGTDVYQIQQFHFHAPSENAINGRVFPLEMHLVHKTQNGEMAVLGVMIQQGGFHNAVQQIWDHLPSKSGDFDHDDDQMVNAALLLPSGKKYFHFKGSLTTPPCTEGVNWYVLKEPIEMSAEQIAKFTAIYPANARPLQARNHRVITLDQDAH